MCTVVLLRRPGSRWPLLLAANRDELKSRPWRPPGRHWPDRPDVVAGLDEQAGGSWLGINDHGVVAAVLNRVGTLGPATGKRTRGELVLEALDHADAAAAAAALADLDPAAYRPFNLIVADNRDAFWLRHAGDAAELRLPHPQRQPARGRADPAAGRGAAGRQRRRPRSSASRSRTVSRCSPRASSTTRPRRASRTTGRASERAPPPDPDADDWEAWTVLLADRSRRRRRPAQRHGDRDRRRLRHGLQQPRGPAGVRSADHEVRGRPAGRRHPSSRWRCESRGSTPGCTARCACARKVAP